MARVTALVLIGTAAGLLGTYVGMPGWPQGRHFAWLLRCWPVSVALAAWFVACYSQRRWMRSWLEYLDAEDYQVCVHCGGTLRGLPASRACPTCSRVYDLSEATETWKRWAAEARARGLIRAPR